MDKQLVCDDAPAREGDNELKIVLKDRDAVAVGALCVEGVEVLVSYSPRLPHQNGFGKLTAGRISRV